MTGGPSNDDRVLDTVVSGPAPSDRPVLYSEGRWVDAEKLRELSERVAARLARGGLDGGLIAVALNSGAELAATVAACLRYRCPFLLLDPDAPVDRLRDLIARARPDVVIARRHDLLRRLRDRPTWHLDQVLGADDLAPVRVLDPHPEWGYVVATSGSTGAPKLVVIGRDSLALHVTRTARAYQLTANDVIMQGAVPGFDVWIEEVVVGLANRARVVTLGSGLKLAVADFDRLVRHCGCTVLNLPVGYWRAWMGWLRSERASVPPTVRLVVVGSEAVPRDAALDWFDLAPHGPQLLSAYGLSEATVTSFVHTVRPDTLPLDSPSVPLGRPLAGATYELEPVAEATSDEGSTEYLAELVLTGLDVRCGQLAGGDSTARPGAYAETGRRLLVDTGGRLPTGDLVRFIDGHLCFAGRRDDQVKIRGHRISILEVEGALRADTEVADAAVVVVAGELAACVVPAVTDLKPTRLRHRVARRMPAAYVPAHLVPVAALPLLANGKVDRSAVATLVTPARPTEVANPIGALMSDVLGSQLGDDEDFFAAGAHSLLAINLLKYGCSPSLGTPCRSPRSCGHVPLGPCESSWATAAQPQPRPARSS